jgi:tryptophanyl-tRNA synthetase
MLNLEHQRVLTGMRTTGRLHLGHYVGALKQWKEVQDQGTHDSYFLLANVQALTTHSDKPQILPESVRHAVLDWLSVGLDPFLSNIHFVLQSHIPERFELFAYLMMVAKHAEVMRNPTLKTELSRQPNASMGMVAYPVDEAADILMVSPLPRKNSELVVPAGEDQLPLLELTREIARDFNRAYGKVFVEPIGRLGKVARLVGPDGQEKMGKSLGNAINLSDPEKVVTEKVMKMYTDPTRLRATDPGETVNNPVFVYLRAFASHPEDLATVSQLTEEYHQGKVGDVQVKRTLVRILNEFLDPIRAKRVQFENFDIRDIVVSGTRSAREKAIPVVNAVRERMFLKYPDSK